jgi:wobble nucleotide-excising tRNase
MAQARIRRIKKVGDYRAFKNWTDGGRPKEFQRVNLIYGTNGSGKSTFSSLIRDASIGATFSPAPQLELEVETAGTKSSVTETDATFWPRIRVFNADYVRDNLHFDDLLGPSSNSLLTLGKLNVDAEKELKDTQKRADELMPKIQPAKVAASKADKALQDRLSKIASDVVDNLRESSVAKYRATNSYTKANVRTLLEGDQRVFETASTDVSADRATAVSKAKGVVSLLARGVMADSATVKEVRELLNREITVKVLEELRGHEDRAEWVQMGIPLHDGLESCLFCGQSLTEDRRSELAAHFSDALTKLQEDADQLIKTLNSSVDDSKAYQDEIPRDADLYSDLAGELSKARTAYKDAHNNYAKNVKVIVSVLTSKRHNPFDEPNLDSTIDLPPPTTTDVDIVVAKHNARSESHKDEAERAARRVELARVSDFRTEYASLKQDAADKKAAAETAESELRILNERIVALQNVSADPVPKAEELTKNVERLLGRGELKFTTTSDGKHYVIERGGTLAKHLSEGERTAVALLHFLASIQDDVVAGDEPVVVIDDPVSSMDDSILFGASSYLWTELVRKTFASQVFLLTHNFELFRQWLIQLERARNAVAGGFTVHELRMRYETDSSGETRRSAQFDPWTNDEKLSRRLQSLYHFLFARVAGAVIEATPEVSLAERMDLLALAPNAARKMMESFLSFRFPDKIGDFRGGMESALAIVKDAAVRNQVERYLHAYSHNEEGNISAVVDPSEATVVLRSLFEMMKAVDDSHFSAMCKALLIDEAQLLQIPAATGATAL